MTERRKCGIILVMKVKSVNVEQIFLGAVASTVATEVAIEMFPKLRPFAPIAQKISGFLLVGSLLLLAEKGQLRR